jgi:hypothetical protein
MVAKAVGDFLLEHAADATVSAIVSAVVSLGFGILNDRRQKIAKRAEAIDVLIEQISGIAAAYWRSSGIHSEREEKLIADLEKLDERVTLHGKETLRDDLDRITQWITGGAFQTADRRPDPQRASTIKQELLELRRKIGA